MKPKRASSSRALDAVEAGIVDLRPTGGKLVGGVQLVVEDRPVAELRADDPVAASLEAPRRARSALRAGSRRSVVRCDAHCLPESSRRSGIATSGQTPTVHADFPQREEAAEMLGWIGDIERATHRQRRRSGPWSSQASTRS